VPRAEEGKVRRRNATPVVGDGERFGAPTPGGHRDGGGAGVERIFEELLEGGGGAGDDLAGGDEVDDFGRELPDGGGGGGCRGSNGSGRVPGSRGSSGTGRGRGSRRKCWEWRTRVGVDIHRVEVGRSTGCEEEIARNVRVEERLRDGKGGSTYREEDKVDKVTVGRERFRRGSDFQRPEQGG